MEGLGKTMRWSQYGLSAGQNVIVTEITNDHLNGEPYATIIWYSTEFQYSGSYRTIVNSKSVHAEVLFSGEETDKLRIRARSMQRIDYEDIESVLSMSLTELKHKHRGSLKGKKFGL